MEQLILGIVSIIGGIAVVAPTCIEILKNLIGEEKIINIFGKMEVFSLVFSTIAGVVGIIIIVLFMPQLLADFNVAQKIFIGIAFVVICAIGSQVSYDKVMKWLLALIKK